DPAGRCHGQHARHHPGGLMTGYPVQTHQLGLRYGDRPALQEVTLELTANRIHGLLGRNGAGKTSLMSVLAALRRRSAGQVHVNGQDPFENEAVMENVCLIRESGDLLLDEKLRTSLYFLQNARPHFDRPFAESFMEASRLDPRAKLQSLSRGQASAFGALTG